MKSSNLCTSITIIMLCAALPANAGLKELKAARDTSETSLRNGIGEGTRIF